MEKDYIGRNKDYIGYKKEDHALGDFFFFLLKSATIRT